MFQGGFWELSLIFVLALVVFGPERLPGLARSLGLWAGRARALLRNFNEQLERELAAEEMRSAAQAARDTLRDAVQPSAKDQATEAVKHDGTAG
jgi:sec-independent protein translocase protein TatB